MNESETDKNCDQNPIFLAVAGNIVFCLRVDERSYAVPINQHTQADTATHVHLHPGAYTYFYAPPTRKRLPACWHA